ncbi:hypothetical protein [Hydrogenophaga sp. BPS33]|uniref:hypothetical protein n=1 Tax=Hydrogenophaga sp. BPS33 TaxID=2651974 RepID=UPI00131FECB8|nr:hypothetical protein [Hydrogenophaga sp. BPS33]QHE89381.1 hypothetical protein F9K07_30885 [Hydrogenophaga sp. BPS33]
MALISPRWMKQVFADRGVMATSVEACAAYADSLDADGHASLFAKLRRIEGGVESAGEIDSLLALIRSASHSNRVTKDTLQVPAPAPRAVPARSGKQSGQSVQERNRESGQAPWWYDAGVHVYGQKAAFKIELEQRREDQPDGGQFTVQLEFAEAKGARAFDWVNKIGFQFTRRELPLLGAMLMGYAGDALDLANHGPEQDKRLELRQQGGRLFVKLRKGVRAIAIPVEPADVYEWSVIVLTALKKNRTDLDSASILEILKRTGAMHVAPTNQRKTL